MKTYLISYSAYYKKGTKIGEDRNFSGDGIFYIKSKNIKEAKKHGLREIRRMFNKPIKTWIDDVEEAE